MLKKDANVMDLFTSDNEKEFRYVEVDGGIRIIAYTGSNLFLKIPDVIDGKTVVEIGEPINERITSIRPEILLPKTIDRFDPDAFNMAPHDLWFKNIYISDDNAHFKTIDGVLYSYDLKILYLYFKGQDISYSRKPFQIPSNVEIVKKGAFRFAKYLSVELPENLEIIEDYAFNIINFKDKIELPQTVYSIGVNAFGGNISIKTNDEIKELKGPVGVGFEINNSNFITENNILYSSDKKNVFGYCGRSYDSSGEITSEKALSFDSQNEIIFPHAFERLSRLEKLELGSSIRKIGSKAFYKARIKTIRIPSQVEEIADDAFGYEKCTSIIVDKQNKKFFTDKTCLYRNESDGTKTLMKCFKNSIEEYIIQEGTTKINEDAFQSCSELKTIVLPTALIEFDGNCLRQTSVKQINIPANVKELCNISNYEYLIDSENQHYIAADGVLYAKKGNGFIAIEGKENLKNVELIEGTIEIGPGAFANNANLSSVVFPESLIKIGCHAFFRCGISEVLFNNGLKYIDECAFKGCNIKQVLLPDSIEYVCRTAFNGSIEEFTANGQNYISEDGVLFSKDKINIVAFPSSKDLDEYNVPDGVVNIGNAFSEAKISKITLPDSVRVIPDKSFNSCALDFYFGNDLVYIAEDALRFPWKDEDIKPISLHGYSNTVICDYVSYLRQKKENIVINLELYGMEQLSSLSEEFELLPDGDGVSISGLKKVNRDITIPGKIENYDVNSIDHSAFNSIWKSCEDSTVQDDYSITIQSSKTKFDYAIIHKFNTVNLPEGMKTIPEGAFASYGCRVKKINLPDSLEILEDSCFSSCKHLENINIPKSITAIGAKAFSGCEALTEITIPGSVKVLSEGVFSGCGQIKKITLEDGVERIEKNAFSQCSRLEYVIIPESVNYIDSGVFGQYSFYINRKTVYITVPGSYADSFLRMYKIDKDETPSLCVMTEREAEEKSNEVVFNAFEYALKEDGTLHVILKNDVDIEEPDVTIPEIINGKKVTEVTLAKYSIRPSLVSIRIPAFVTIINTLVENAFSGYSAPCMKNIFVDDDNKSYFSDGKALFTKDKSKLIHIFAYDIEEYSIPDGVKVICKSAFAYQKNLHKLYIPESVENIEDLAFYECGQLIDIEGIEHSKQVAASAVNGTPFLYNKTIVILGSTLVKFADYSCVSYHVQEGITEIAKGAFNFSPQQVFNLKELELPSTLKTIGNIGGNFPYLTKFDIPDGVKEIPYGFFFGMNNIKSVHLPASVSSIGAGAFPGCYSRACLEEIQIDSSNSTYKSINGIVYTNDEETIIAVPCHYPNASIVVPDSVKTIAEKAFSGNDTIVDIILSKSVKNIGIEAFRECNSLKNINLECVEEIGHNAFYGCKSLESVTLNCKEIKESSFFGCTSLKNIVLDKTESVSEHAFSNGAGSGNFAEVKLPETLLHIGKSAFYGKFVSKVVIPKSVVDVGYFAFGGSKHIVVHDNLNVNIRTVTNQVLDSKKFGYIGSLDRRNNTIPRHRITVVSAKDNMIKQEVLMLSDGSNEYENILKNSWNEDASFNFSEMDDYFVKLSGADIKLAIAIERICNPFDLSDKAKETYSVYITKNTKVAVKNAIDRNLFNVVQICADYGGIKKTNIDELIEYAVQNQAIEFSAYLMDYKENNFGTKKKGKDELSLPAAKKVACWKVAKTAISMVDRYKGNDTRVDYPTEIAGVSITGIANATNKIPENYKAIVAVKIPEGYKFIGTNAFLDCINLEMVELPSSLEEIGDYAFAGCTKLKSIILPSGLLKIGTGCFANCESLETVELPVGLTELKGYTFNSCKSLKFVDIPRNIERLGTGCFANSSLANAIIRNRKPWLDYGVFDDQCKLLTYKGALSEKSVKEVQELTLAEMPSDTVLSISVKDAAQMEQVCDLFLKKMSATFTGLSSEVLSNDFATFNDGTAIKKWLFKTYGQDLTLNEDAVSALSDLEKCERIEYVTFKEEKNSPDGITTAKYSYDMASNTGTFERFGKFSPEKKMDSSYKFYFVEEEEDYSMPMSNSSSIFAFSNITTLYASGKIFVLTGFSKADEDKLTNLIIAKGGEVKSSVVLKTDYLIVNPDYDHETSKYIKALELNKQGKSICIISDSDLKKYIE